MKKSIAPYLEALIRNFCTRDELATYDPYDIWKTATGFRVKKLYNRSPRLGLAPAGVFALLDDLANDNLRLGYTRGEYPIVRAMAALCLLNVYRHTHDASLIGIAERHLRWLLANSSPGNSGYCWGLGFPSAVSKDVIYDSDTPFSTITPYALEAFIGYTRLTKDRQYLPVIDSIFRFFDQDLQVMEEDDEALATSYGPFRDRTVINAVSYTMYAYSLYRPFASVRQRERIEARARKLYNYVRRNQRPDGSWFYSPHGKSFIDCFHSCIVLKNIFKSDRIVPLPDAGAVIASGYDYLKRSFLDKSTGLFRRFSVRNKQGLVRFDLYDNAEALNLALLVGDTHMAQRLVKSVVEHFCDGPDIYSQIDFIGLRRKKNTLRWAVMPFLYAVSQTAQHSRTQHQEKHGSDYQYICTQANSVALP